MKRPLIFVLVAFFCATATLSATAKTSAKDQVNMWLGTWNCVSGKSHYTAVFTPILNGTAMRVTDSGPNAGESLARFDTSQNKWFYTSVGMNGSYSTMIGPISGATITFNEVFPQAGAILVVHRTSKSTYSDAFTVMNKGKKMTSNEVCTRT